MSISLVLDPPHVYSNSLTTPNGGFLQSDGNFSGRQGVNYQGTVWGSTIPLSAGYRKVSGVVTWAGPLIKQNVQSKYTPAIPGIPSSFSTNESIWQLAQTFAVDFGFRLNPNASPKVRRVWADNTLVYSNGSSFPLQFAGLKDGYISRGSYLNGVWVPDDPENPQPAPTTLVFTDGSTVGTPGVPPLNPIMSKLTFRFYDGSATQQPDQAIVADLGPLAPAFRRHMYMVIEGLVVGTGRSYSADLTAFGQSPLADVQDDQQTVPPHYPQITVELVDGNDVVVTTHDFATLPGAEAFQFPSEVVLANFDTRELVVIAPSGVSPSGFVNVYSMDGTQTASNRITGATPSSDEIGPTAGFAVWDKLNDVFYTEQAGDVCIVSLRRSGAVISAPLGLHFNLFPETSAHSSTVTDSDPATIFPRPNYGDMAYVLSNGEFLPCLLAGNNWVAAFCPSSAGVIPGQLIPEQYYEASNSIKAVKAFPLAQDGALKERLSYQDACFVVSNTDGIQFVYATVRNGVSKILGRHTVYASAYAGTGNCVAMMDNVGNLIIQDTAIGQPDLLIKITVTTSLTADFTIAPGWRGLFPSAGATLWTVSTAGMQVWEGNAVRESNVTANNFCNIDTLVNFNDGSVTTITGFPGVDSRSTTSVWDSTINVRYFHGTLADGSHNMRYAQAYSGINGDIDILSGVLTDFALAAGFTVGDLDVDPSLTDPIPGVLIKQPYDLSSLFNDIGAIYDFTYFNSGNKLKFARASNNPTKASGGITIIGTENLTTLHTDTVVDGDTVTIGTYVYTFRHTPAAPFDVKISDDTLLNNVIQLDAKFKCAANLLAAINADLTLAAPDSLADAFFPGTLKNTLVTASATKAAITTLGNASISLTAIVGGLAGNSIVTSKTGTHITVDHATLQGGTIPPEPVMTITRDALALAEEQQISQFDALITTIVPFGQSQQAAAVTYYALEQDYQPAMQTFIPDNQGGNLGPTGQTTVTYALPFVMSTSEAYARVAKTAFRIADNVIGQQFRLPQSYLLLEPSDVIAIQIPPFAYTIRLDEATFNGDMSTSFSALNYATRNDVDIGFSDSQSRLPQTIASGSDCLPLVIDAPTLDPLNATIAGVIDLYDGLRAYLTGFGSGTLAMGKVVTGQAVNFDSLFTTSVDAKWATSASIPAAVAPYYRTVEDSLLLNLKTARTTDFASASYEDFVAGKNCIAIGQPGAWEYVYFRDVAVINSRVVKLTGLIRAQRGTDAFVTHTDSDYIVLLASAASGFNAQMLRPQSLDSTEVGAVYEYRANGIPSKHRPVSLDVTVHGYGLYPFSPCVLKATLIGGNDLTLAWSRRDRQSTEFVTTAPPLSETTEEYDLEILSGTTVVRTVLGLTSPTYTYTSANQTTDGFSPPLATLKFRVYQIGELGRGFPGTEIVNVH